MNSYHLFLAVKKGEPYEEGTHLELKGEEILIGRLSDKNQPDISFANKFISRNHAVIQIATNQVTIKDLESKHGIAVNERNIDANKPHYLHHGDEIILAKGAVILTFNNLLEINDETVDFSTEILNSVPLDSSPAENPFLILPDRREVIIDNRNINVSGKDLDLLLLLYKKKNKAIGFDEIKINIWPERQLGEGIIPDVGNDEIAALVYRLRKRLGRYDKCVVSIPRFGYRLDV